MNDILSNLRTIIVLIGPKAAGKSTLIQDMINNFQKYSLSCSPRILNLHLFLKDSCLSKVSKFNRRLKGIHRESPVLVHEVADSEILRVFLQFAKTKCFSGYMLQKYKIISNVEFWFLDTPVDTIEERKQQRALLNHTTFEQELVNKTVEERQLLLSVLREFKVNVKFITREQS